MLTGLGGKIMSYDGENRPLSVTHLGKRTCYVYGAAVQRLKKVEGLAPPPRTAARCRPMPRPRSTSARSRCETGRSPARRCRRHKGRERPLQTFGEQSDWLLPGTPAPETKGRIGERFDADAGLQYLNARHYDPELALFLQPDWFEVTKAGVGTNRFSYSFNDPVNKLDPGGNESEEEKERKKKEEEDRQKKRDARHIENARISARLGAEMVADGYGWDDPLVQQHFGNARREDGMIGNSAFGEFWDVLGQPALDAALIGAPAGIAITQTARNSLNGARVFWSGQTAAQASVKDAAAILARNSGATTLEMTVTGKTLDVLAKIKNPVTGKSVIPNKAWDWASRRFASSATSATVVLGSSVRPTSTWIRVEMPTLIQNGISRIERVYP